MILGERIQPAPQGRPRVGLRRVCFTLWPKQDPWSLVGGGTCPAGKMPPAGPGLPALATERREPCSCPAGLALASHCTSSLPSPLTRGSWGKVDLREASRWSYLEPSLGLVTRSLELDSFGVFPCGHQLSFSKPEFAGGFSALRVRRSTVALLGDPGPGLGGQGASFLAAPAVSPWSARFPPDRVFAVTALALLGGNQSVREDWLSV